KLGEFVKGKMVPSVAEKYLREVVEREIPKGLKKYLELELFPHLQWKVGSKGVSLSTLRRWLLAEGFRFISWKKGLYFDGHDRPDVVKYRQEEFLPKMSEFHARLAKFVVGNVGDPVPPQNYVERVIVLVAHDEMTAQANDSRGKSWVFEDQHALRKKGVGRGL